MNIQAEKLKIMKLILETENPTVLESIYNIFKKETQVDFWDELSDECKSDIQEGIRDFENGHVVDYVEFMKAHR